MVGFISEQNLMDVLFDQAAAPRSDRIHELEVHIVESHDPISAAAKLLRCMAFDDCRCWRTVASWESSRAAICYALLHD